MRFLNLTDSILSEGLTAYMNMDRNDSLMATAYQRACYDNDANSLQCGQFIQRQLRWTSNQDAPCPFSSNICLLGDTTAYRMDTGLIDSHDGLGISAPKKERVQYRNATTCSPIQTRDYGRATNDTDINSSTFGDTHVRYFCGELGNWNYTYQYNTHSLEEDNGYKLM